MNDEPSSRQRLPLIIRKKLWLTSFGDMTALMLTFFILLFSLSTFDRLMFQGLADSTEEISKDIRFDKSLEPRFTPQSKNIDTINIPPGLSLAYLRLIIENAQVEDPRLADMIITPRSNRLILSIPSTLLFRPGSAQLNTDAKEILFHLASLIENTGNKIQVTGHTDSSPIRRLYPSNWELSLARAINVANILKKSGITTPLDISGHADGQQKLLETQLGSLGEKLLSRRVDIEILAEEHFSRN